MRTRWVVVAAVLGACDRSAPSPPLPTPSVPALAPGTIDPPAARGASAPNLFATPGGEIWLTWLEPVDEARRAHRMRVAKLAGASWSPPVTITEGARVVANWADVPSVAGQRDGSLVAHWAEKIDSPVSHAYTVVLARSRDGGATWTRLGSPHRDGTASEHGFVSLVPDGDGMLVTWLDGRETGQSGGATMLRAARIGETIGEEQIVDERVCDCCSTAAIATSTGPAIVYRDRSDKELRDPWIARRLPDGWSRGAVHADGWEIAGCPVNGPAIAARESAVVVAWYTYAAQRAVVRIAFSGDGGATFDTPIEVDAPRGARAPIGRVEVVLDGAEAIVSWMASEREDARVLVRRIARDRRKGSELPIATIAAARAGGFPRMKAVGDDLVFAWTDVDAGALRASRVARSAVPAVTTAERVPETTQTSSFAIGSRAPTYAATRLDGRRASLGDAARPTLVNVWATWCEPCRHELPALAKLQRRLGTELHVVALSVDREGSRDRVAQLVQRLAPELETWLDPDDKASTAFGVMTLPTTLLFDRDGLLVWRHDGAIADGDAELDAALVRLNRRL